MVRRKRKVDPDILAAIGELGAANAAFARAGVARAKALGIDVDNPKPAGIYTFAVCTHRDAAHCDQCFGEWRQAKP